MINISTRSTVVCGDPCWASTRDSEYIIVYFRFLPCKNYSALVSSFVASFGSSFVSSFVSSLTSSLASSSFSSTLVSAGAGSDSLGAARLEYNSKLDFWASSKAFLKSAATREWQVSFGLTQNWLGAHDRSSRNGWPRSQRWEVPPNNRQQPSIPSFGQSRHLAATSYQM